MLASSFCPEDLRFTLGVNFWGFLWRESLFLERIASFQQEKASEYDTGQIRYNKEVTLWYKFLEERGVTALKKFSFFGEFNAMVLLSHIA